MAYISENELKFLRLLERTKRLTKEDMSANVWKVSAATKILNKMIYTLQNDETTNDILHEYRQEVLQLKLLAEAESKSSAEERLKVIEKIPRVFPDVQVTVADSKNDNEAESYDFEKESAAGLRATQRSIYRSDLRKQLLSSNKHRAQDTSEDQEFMKNELVEEELANSLATMARSFKTMMSAAGDVIKEDTERAILMAKEVDDNKTALGIQSERVERHAYKCGYDCFKVMLIVLIFMSFVSMVLMMKIFKKAST
ncbi:Vesicle transport protein USE1 [Caenorhabditis elegans]|uniref:Vesicle transport protein USE1 n=1 Tax=Caenorhabditis elegans TaxID=6239 RepID=USE1_CAEEL|nr:Vesicle transport protein USE1 [Caenorhabditis elegans]Q9N598.2 RecName: Full=Vesicle transport protein USE1; AltName: Full=USE1-like protein [Caenorhabditis elegans]CCD66202.1 Vesicle transport protein USE1 [Caenorhabditis elegans]|eukprot:NP_491521.2 Vesicle transport protein USE1 [Caenorhabditis elegans]